MIEGINQAHSLIEKFLCLRIRGRNRMMQVTQPGHQRGFLFRRLRLCAVLLRAVLLSKDRTAKGKWNQDERQEFHWIFSSVELRSWGFLRFYTPEVETEESAACGYCFLPNISRSSAVVCAAGSLRIFFSSSPIT